jgi:hypothetical protein
LLSFTGRLTDGPSLSLFGAAGVEYVMPLEWRQEERFGERTAAGGVAMASGKLAETPDHPRCQSPSCRNPARSLGAAVEADDRALILGFETTCAEDEASRLAFVAAWSPCWSGCW